MEIQCYNKNGQIESISGAYWSLLRAIIKINVLRY